MFLPFLILGRTVSVIFIVLRYSVFSRCSNDVKFKLILQNLGGVFVKLGQIIAMRFDVLPAKYAYSLWDLFDKEPSLSNEEVFFVFKSETGKDIKEIFDYIEEKPIAVASFAQVYKARYKKEQVVIKIQKPGVKLYIKADLFVLKFIAFILDAFGVLKSITVKEVIIQLEHWLKDELDYRIEANNNQIIYKHITEKHHLENVFSPKIYWDYVTEKVLVQEFINGYPVNKIILDIEKNKEKTEKYLKNIDIDLKIVANEFLIDIMRQYFIDGFFQADPHPANLFALPANNIAWIDFGIVGRPEQKRIWLLKFIKAASENNLIETTKSFINFGNQLMERQIELLRTRDEKNFLVYSKVQEFIIDALAEDFKPIINFWNNSAGNKSLSMRKRSSAVTFLKVIKAGEKYKIKLPPEVVAFIRALLIIDMVCLKMSDEFNMPKAIKMFFNRYDLAKIEKDEENHFKEKQDLYIASINISKELSRELEEEARLKQEEEYFEANEKFKDLVLVLIDKYPELYKSIKDLL